MNVQQKQTQRLQMKLSNKAFTIIELIFIIVIIGILASIIIPKIDTVNSKIQTKTEKQNTQQNNNSSWDEN